MKVLCFVHLYPPDHNAGAEWMLHAINKFLIGKGHKIKVITRNGDMVTMKNGRRVHVPLSGDKKFEGVDILRQGEVPYSEIFKWADVVVTHLDMTGKALNLCNAFNKPLVHLIHNTSYNDVIVKIRPDLSSVVYNCFNTKKVLSYPFDNVVLYPPVTASEYEVETNRKNITLINCWKEKGGNVLVELAKEMPDRKFLGVMGGYGDQVIGNCKNLNYEENTPYIRNVYKKTGVLLMPSSYESWGRTGIEAMASGIPVIAHPTPGLKESLGYAGLFAHRDNIGDWVKILRDLEDETYYNKISEKCKKRAHEVSKETDKQLIEFEKFLISRK